MHGDVVYIRGNGGNIPYRVSIGLLFVTDEVLGHGQYVMSEDVRISMDEHEPLC